jgi:hypothetical protein
MVWWRVQFVGYIQSGDRLPDVLETIWKEVVVDCSWYIPDDIWCPVRDSNWSPPVYMSKALALDQPFRQDAVVAEIKISGIVI